jgi:hypothetical protein
MMTQVQQVVLVYCVLAVILASSIAGGYFSVRLPQGSATSKQLQYY